VFDSSHLQLTAARIRNIVKSEKKASVLFENEYFVSTYVRRTLKDSTSKHRKKGEEEGVFVLDSLVSKR